MLRVRHRLNYVFTLVSDFGIQHPECLHHITVREQTVRSRQEARLGLQPFADDARAPLTVLRPRSRETVIGSVIALVSERVAEFLKNNPPPDDPHMKFVPKNTP